MERAVARASVLASSLWRTDTSNLPELCGMLNPETEEASVSRAVTEAQGSLLGNLNQLISSELETFQDKISENQKNLADSQLSKINNNILSNDGYSFKRKSCEDQYKFKAKVLDRIQDAEAFLEQTHDGASVAAREKVSKGDIFDYFIS